MAGEEQVLRDVERVYLDVGRRGGELRASFPDRYLGFAILHSPLVARPSTLVLGMQPNLRKIGDALERIPQGHDKSPFGGTYELALLLTSLFHRAGHTELLSETQMFDLNFFGPLKDFDVKEDGVEFDQDNLEFCKAHARDLILSIRPRRIVTLGHTVLKSLLPSDKIVKANGIGKILDVGLEFSFQGIPITPVHHLSGTWNGENLFKLAHERLRRDLERDGGS